MVKMPINELTTGQHKSQINESSDFLGGPVVHYIAVRTESIIETDQRMNNYEKLPASLQIVIQVQEDIDIQHQCHAEH